MPKSTVHDHLKTLMQTDCLVQEDGTYRVGTRFLEFGGYVRYRMPIFRIGKPEVKRLAEKTGQHANIMIEEHGYGLFLYKETGEDAVRDDTHEGMRVYLQTTALGKAIMAHLPEERTDEILDERGMPEVTENTITDRTELKETLEEIRQRGYAFDDEERIEGMRCVAAPITGPDDQVLGAISVSAPVSRLQNEQLSEEIPDAVTAAANVIEVNVTHSDLNT